MIAALVLAAARFAHARVSPPVSLSKELQLFSLAVPTEKEGAVTTKIVLTVPSGFSIDSFVPSPGWHRVLQQTGSGEDAVIQKVTWTGGSVPTGEDSTFWFLGAAVLERHLHVRGPADLLGRHDRGLERLRVRREPGADDRGEGLARRRQRTSLLTIVALVVGAIGLILGAVALFAGGGKRQLA